MEIAIQWIASRLPKDFFYRWRFLGGGGVTQYDVNSRDVMNSNNELRDVTHRIVWRYMTWHDVMWRDMTLYDVTWCYVTWHDVIWRDRIVTWYDAMVCNQTWCYMPWHDVMWRDMTLCDVIWRYMTWHDAKSCNMMLDNVRDVIWRGKMLYDVIWSYMTVKNRVIIKFPFLLI